MLVLAGSSSLLFFHKGFRCSVRDTAEYYGSHSWGLFGVSRKGSIGLMVLKYGDHSKVFQSNANPRPQNKVPPPLNNRTHPYMNLGSKLLSPESLLNP